MDLSLRVVRDADGLPLRYALCARDVTLARCRDQARVLGTRFRGLLEAAPDALLIAGPEGRILLANREARRLFAYGPDEMTGLPVDTLVPALVRDRHRDHRKAYFADPRTRSMGAGRELSGVRRDGSEFPAEISLSPLETEDGVLVSAAVRDLSDRLRLEELRRQAAALTEDRRRAEEQNRHKSEFLANMSHELRTPLNSIVGFAELIHDGKVGPVNSEQREYLGDVLASARHLVQLINDLLDLSKVEAGWIELVPQQVDLLPLLVEVRDGLRPLSRPRGIEIEIEVDPGVREVTADPGRLRQVLWNYLSNAVKFTPDQGHVAVRALPEGAAAFRLEVEDDGAGIVAEDQARLFVAFQQLDVGAANAMPGPGWGWP